ncbi:hypothetical protein M0R45_019339 [Rubus argutus]|uniref:MHC class I antigen n=1 Tax=Rubus argutus TaxID=59490 RepID=A0AAW1X6G6_RUBAR
MKNCDLGLLPASVLADHGLGLGVNRWVCGRDGVQLRHRIEGEAGWVLIASRRERPGDASWASTGSARRHDGLDWLATARTAAAAQGKVSTARRRGDCDGLCGRDVMAGLMCTGLELKVVVMGD